MAHNYFFVRIAWMNKYRGIIDDTPHGAGSFVDLNGTGGEVYNFLPIRGRYYGYSRNQNNRSYDLTKVGGTKNTDQLNNKTVVFFATNPIHGGQYVVGWYKNAIVYKRPIQLLPGGRGEYNFYSFSCKKVDGKLLTPLQRGLALPKGPGETNVWYPKEENPEHQKWLKKLNNYTNKSKWKYQAKHKNRKSIRQDALKKATVEIIAMNLAIDYFEAQGFRVKDVSKANKGWDLEATYGTRTYLIEVKGISSKLGSIQLTPNELKNSMRNKYLIAITSEALTVSPKFEIFVYHKSSNLWIGNQNSLNIIEYNSAILRAE